MKVGTPILIMLGAGALLAFRTFKRQGNNADIQLLTGGFSSINIREIKGNLTFRVINPEPISLKLKGMFFKIYILDKEVASISNFTEVNVSARSEQSFKLNFSIPMLALVASIPTIIDQLNNKKIEVALDGFCDTSVGRINIEKQLSFALPTI